MAKQDRINVDLRELRTPINSHRDDPAWQALSMSKKIRLLIEMGLEKPGCLPGESDSSKSEISDSEMSELKDNLQQMSEFIKLLMSLRPRQGISFAEIADITGLSSRQVEDLYQLVKKCREQYEHHK